MILQKYDTLQTEVGSNSFTTQGQDILPQPLLTSLSLLLEHDIKQSISTTFKLKLANTNVHRYLQCYTHGPQSSWI